MFFFLFFFSFLLLFLPLFFKNAAFLPTLGTMELDDLKSELRGSDLKTLEAAQRLAKEESSLVPDVDIVRKHDPTGICFTLEMTHDEWW